MSETPAPSFHDKLYQRGAYPDLKHFLFNNSEVLNLGLNLVRGWRARRFNNTTNGMMVLDSVRRLVLPDSVMRARLERAGAVILRDTGRRLNALADTCLAWHIVPVFVTQPDQFGFGRDPVTGADLAAFPVDITVNGAVALGNAGTVQRCGARDVCGAGVADDRPGAADAEEQSVFL